jgi:surface carbohydrate biosynthesis protein (TIGR04326 family)
MSNQVVIYEKTPRRYKEDLYYICWSGFSARSNVTSVIDYVENNGTRLRSVFLTWVHNLGQTQVIGKSLIEQLTVVDGLSHWWMTLLAEKSVYKSDINTAIKILALEEIIYGLNPSIVCVESDDPILTRSAEDLCRKLGWKFKKDKPTYLIKWYIPDIALSALQFIIGGAYLASYYILRGNVKNVPVRNNDSGKSVFICSYLSNLDIPKAKNGEFESGYWQGFEKHVKSNKIYVSWLQIFYKHKDVPNTNVAGKIISQLNSGKDNVGWHYLLESFINLSVLCQVVICWIKLSYKLFKLRGIKSQFQPNGYKVSLWPTLRQDWYGSLVGRSCIKSLFYQNLFDRVFGDKPYRCNGFYLCENQSWEIAMLYAWRKHCSGKIFGVVHGTVRFWDLRYFEDPRSYEVGEQNQKPMPDLMVINGYAAYKNLLNSGFPEKYLYRCEALRYNYLYDQIDERKNRLPQYSQGKLLLLGDYLREPTNLMFDVVMEAGLSSHYEITYKPHPNQSFIGEEYHDLRLKFSTEPLSNLLRMHEVILAPYPTSAAVDAYCLGLKVIILLDCNAFNLSPLRGWPDVYFIRSAEDLKGVLLHSPPPTCKLGIKNYFDLDPSIPRWKALLELENPKSKIKNEKNVPEAMA